LSEAFGEEPEMGVVGRYAEARPNSTLCANGSSSNHVYIQTPNRHQMTLDGFLVFLTLIFAAYGVASSATRLRLRLRPFSISFISIIGFILVIYYEMFAQNGFPCPSRLGRLCRFLILSVEKFPTAGEVAFIIVIVWLLTAWFVLTRKTIPAGALSNLRRLVDELVYERRQAELLEVVEPHLPLLASAATRKLRGAAFYDRLKRWRRRETLMELHAHGVLNEAQQPPTFWKRALYALKFGIGSVGRVLPEGKPTQEAAEEILPILLLNQDLIEFIALYRAAFGVSLLALRVREVDDFSNEYLKALISAPGSTFHAEVRNNQNYERATQYAFPEENRLLHFLLADARQAERLGVWKPLGEWIIARLRPDRHPDYTGSLNLSSDAFDDECWEDPTFVVIQFFDLMVSAAEYQDVRWHMWLYYFPHILERLLEIYSDVGPGVDLEYEDPTRAAYIIHAMFRAMRDWITAVNHLPENSSQLTLDNEGIDHENGNIPKSAILALGTCLRDLLLAENVGERFKQTIVDLVIRGVGQLPRNGPRSAFRRVMIVSVVQGGPHLGPNDRTYGRRLKAGYLKMDHVLRGRLDDLTSAMHEAC
jgi:hypothetical protein